MPVSFDALLKKYFVAVVLGLLAIAAYFEAAGFSHLLGSALAPEAPDAPPSKPLASRLPPFERPKATAILERNPFDSVTGPLVGQNVELPEVPQEVEIHEPLSAPACDGVKVHIVTESTDPLWSLAAIQGPGESHPSLRRVGDSVGDRKVAYIGYNPVEASPAVWLEGSSLCQSLMFAEEPVARASSPASAPAVKDDAPRAGGPGAVDPDIKNRIQKVSDNEFNVDRGVVDKILENQAELMKSARIVPEQKDGQVVGIRLFGVRPDTLLGTLGLQNGDRLESINGFDMGSPEKALEAYARLRTASNMSVKVNRRGQPMTIEYKIK
jgi:general secretion pathway protein C